MLSKRQNGFTLIEIMVALAIFAVLVRLALPSYQSYIIRGNVVAATNALASARASMEQYYLDNRQYTQVSSTITPPCATSQTAKTFTVSCTGTGSVLTATAYTIVATGSGVTSGFTYTVDQLNNQKTTSMTPWGTVTTSGGYNCWVMKPSDAPC